MSVADGTAVGLLAEALAEYVSARAVVESKGATYETVTQTGSAIVRQRPEVALAADAWRRTAAMMQQFGLTPSSRTRITVTLPAMTDPFEEFLKKKAK